MMSIPAFCGSLQENQARPKLRKGATLTDITNIKGVGLGHQSGSNKPLLDPKTPARRSKSGGFAVFDDGVFGDGDDILQSAPRRASPPQVRPKSRSGDEECILGGSNQMLGIEELVEGDLPPIQDFADRVSEQDRYWDAFGLDDGPDGFGRPEDLARMLGQGTASACFEADAPVDWDIPEASAPCPSIEELNQMAWRSLSPSPKRKLDEPGFGAFGMTSSPLLPPLDLEMDIDSGSDDENGHSCATAFRPPQVGEPPPQVGEPMML